MENIKKKFQMVIARYNEDITWLLPFKDIVIIYNKGIYIDILNNFHTINLKNYGRESHTYLYHIITNYDNLSDKIIFFQGKIRDHHILDIEDYFKKDDFIAKLNNMNFDFLKTKIKHTGKWKKEINSGNMKLSLFTPYDWITKIIGIDINSDTSKIVWGANFSVSKEMILSKPKIFYENILRYIDYHINPEEGHFLERTWYTIFHSNIIFKKKIGYINIQYNKIKDILNNIMHNYEEIHIWNFMISNEKIDYTPPNNQYLAIYPKIIDNNSFHIRIKCNNNANILIQLNENNIYEIVLGGWNNTRSVIRDYTNNKIIHVYEKPILNKNEFIDFKFIISDKILICNNEKIIFDFDNIFNNDINNDINNLIIKIKSNFNSDAFWNYESEYDFDKIKFFIYNSKYDNINIFYQYHYYDYYIEKIEI